MASEAIPPPPPPPPLLNNDNTNTSTLPNGPSTSQVQSSDNGGQTTSTDGTKSWERAWSVDEMRKGATNWSLASDAGVTIFIIRICRKVFYSCGFMAFDFALMEFIAHVIIFLKIIFVIPKCLLY
jgi:hypothetical protein